MQVRVTHFTHSQWSSADKTINEIFGREDKEAELAQGGDLW